MQNEAISLTSVTSRLRHRPRSSASDTWPAAMIEQTRPVSLGRASCAALVIIVVRIAIPIDDVPDKLGFSRYNLPLLLSALGLIVQTRKRCVRNGPRDFRALERAGIPTHEVQSSARYRAVSQFSLGRFAIARRSMISMHRVQISSPWPAGGSRMTNSSGANSSSQWSQRTFSCILLCLRASWAEEGTGGVVTPPAQ